MQIPILLVFFIYGLAFFSLGLAMMLESGRSPLLAEARVLRPLAIFGFVHGFHEWFEMTMIGSDWFRVNFASSASWLRILVLAVSFLALIAFGLRVLQPNHTWPAWQIWLGGGLLVLFLLFVVGITIELGISHQDWITHIDALTRYLLAIPGAGLACLAFFRNARQESHVDIPGLSPSLRWVAFGFGLYCLTQAVVPPVDLFPANWLNVTNFQAFTGLPVQVIRAGAAVLITTSLIRAVQIADNERQRQFLQVQKDRLDALDQVRQDLIEREQMRRDLLRHIVIAQEDERARVARELHDETAQLLTAISLHLGTLEGQAPKTPAVKENILRLKKLSSQMSDSLYRLVHDLRPAMLDNLGLVAALRYLSDEARQASRLQTCVEVSGKPERLDPLLETVFFRVAQEALANVSRHAQVKEAELQLEFNPGWVILRVRDTGVGFDPQEKLYPPHGWGLAGMRERAESVEGQLTITSQPGQGTMVELKVPVEPHSSSIS